MSQRLRDLIRSVRACKTAAEERAVVSKESAAIRTAFKDEDSQYRFRNVAKLLYIHMLGYPTHFGQMECLKLIASPKFPEKRIGYLGMMLLLDDEQEVLILVESSLRNDLFNNNQYIVGLALCSLGNVCNDEMARDLVDEIVKLHKSPNPYIRKKAGLALLRIFRKLPDLIEEHYDRIEIDIKQGSSQHHGMVLTTVSVITEMCLLNHKALKHYRQSIPQLVRMLKGLVVTGYNPEYDVSGITDPFLHCHILRLLRVVAEGDAECAEAMNDILAQVATNTDTSKNVGNSIVYECVLTILSLNCESGLRVLAINILGRFLLNRDNNIRYVALNTLLGVVHLDMGAVQRHRTTVLDCLKDPDISIRRRALDLSYQLVTSQNIEAMGKELLQYLSVADSEFKEDLTSKLCAIFDTHAPSKHWHIDNVLQVLSLGGVHVNEDVAGDLIGLIASSPEIQAYATHRLYAALTDSVRFQAQVQVGVWAIGEYADSLVTGAGAEGHDVPTPTPTQVVDLMERILKSGFTTQFSRFLCVTATMKLTSRFSNSPDSSNLSIRISKLIAPFTESMNLELQQRTCEYAALFKPGFDSIRPALLETMPFTQDPEKASRKKQQLLSTNTGFSAGSASAPGSRSRVGEEPAPEVSGPVAPDAQYTAPGAADQKSGGDMLLDLLMDGPTSTPAPAAAPVNHSGGGANTLLDLLGDMPSGPMPISSQGMGMGMGNGMGMMGNQTGMGMNMGLGMQAAAPTPAPNVGSQKQTLTAFEKNGLKIMFTVSKPNPSQPTLSEVECAFSNSHSSPLENFVFQAAVPKYCKLQLGRATSNVVPPQSQAQVTQPFKIINSQHGQSPAKVLMRITYTVNGQQVQEQRPVDLPGGF